MSDESLSSAYLNKRYVGKSQHRGTMKISVNQKRRRLLNPFAVNDGLFTNLGRQQLTASLHDPYSRRWCSMDEGTSTNLFGRYPFCMCWSFCAQRMAD
jgi:hypothetical protein